MNYKKIFLVEDEGIIANRLKSTLEMMGYKVCGATGSGEKAVELVPQLQPDLVIMDIHLSGQLNGIEAASKIHESIDIPIIYSTAYSDNFFLEKAKATSPYSFLVKPIQDRELYAAIEMAFYRHAIDRQLAESEERYRIISEIISDFAFSVSLHTDGLYSLDWITPVFTELTGFTLDEINGVNTWKKLLSPIDYELIFDIAENLLNGREVEREFRILKRNREPIWINLHAKPIWNENRTKIVKILGAAQDVTQRKYTENELLRLNNELELRVAERTTQLETAVEGLKNEIKNRLLAEDKLSESELRYRTLIANLPEYVIVHVNGKVVYFNDEVLKTSGYSAEEIYNNSVMMFIDMHDRDKVLHMMKSVRKEGKIPENEVKIKLKSGEIRTNIIRTSKIIFGRNEAFLTILLDITQLRETQKQITNSEKKYRTIIGTAIDGFCTLDPNLKILEVNESLVEISGYSGEELLDMKITDLEFNPAKSRLQAFANQFYSSENIRFETRYRKKDGSPIEVEISLKLMDTDEAKLFCFIRDITQSQKMLEALKVSEEKFSKAFITSPDSININRLRDGQYIEINDGFTNLSGYTLEDVRGKNSNEISIWNDPNDRDRLVKELLAKGKIGNFEAQFRVKDGSVRYGLTSASIIEIENEKCIISITRDISERKRIERHLQLQAKLLDSAKDTIFLFDMSGKIIYANEAALSAHGYSFNEILKLGIHDIDNSVHTSFSKDQRLQLIFANGSATFEVLHIRKDGTKFPAEVNSQLITHDGQQFILSVERDITERKITEAALKASEDRYRNLIEYSPDAIAVHSGGKIIYVNPAAVRLIGASSKEELLNRPVLDLMHPDYISFAKDRIEKTLATELPLPAAHEKIIKQNGMPIDVEITSVPISFGDQKALQVILRDITEKREAELELRKLSRAVEQSPAGIIITDLSGKIQYTNPKFTEITGYTFDEVHNKNPRILKSGEHDPNYYKALWDTILSGNEWRGEIRNRKKSGELYWEFVSISGVKNENGELTHFLAVKEDITDRKKIENELIRSKIEAEEANNLKSSLLANMSHELRTPLNGILGFAQLLKDELSDNDHKSMLDKITKSGKRLMNTLNSVLMLTELENNNYLITKSEVDLVFFCHQLKTLYESNAREKKLDLNLSISAENLLIQTDENLLTRILSNIIENAVKYTIKGSITIELKEFTRKDKKRLALINVIDTGMGIKQENQDIIFREFKQLSEGFRRDFEGLGLGLSLARKMSNLIGAEILVESVLGVGSIFTVTLPIEEGESQSKKVFRESGSAGRAVKHQKTENKLCRILLVEDNPLNVEVVQRFLAKNYIVDSARDGYSAINMATEIDYDILMIDINLGQGIDGIQVLNEIKKYSKYNAVPVVALTGYASETNRRDFLQHGFTHYLAKPFEKKELIALLKEITSDCSIK